MRPLLTCLLMGGLSLRLSAALPEDPISYAEWEARLLKSVEEASSWPPERAIPRLGNLMWKLSRPGNMEKDGRPVFSAAQVALLSIPGHAAWYSERIKKITEKEIHGGPRELHSNQRGWDYQTLELLPSPETVEVLGEFLFDERDPWKGGDWGDGGRPYANSTHAARSLHRLGIRNPPVTSKFPVSADLKTWQLWYERVRSGARTFSFQGDDTEYNLEGPVRTDQGEPRAESRKLPSKLESEQISERSSPPSSRLPLIVALILLVLAAGFVIFKSKSRKRSGST